MGLAPVRWQPDILCLYTGTSCQGLESNLMEARSDALILMGDWCGSGWGRHH